jgi:hypothetical protein
MKSTFALEHLLAHFPDRGLCLIRSIELPSLSIERLQMEKILAGNGNLHTTLWATWHWPRTVNTL